MAEVQALVLTPLSCNFLMLLRDRKEVLGGSSGSCQELSTNMTSLVKQRGQEGRKTEFREHRCYTDTGIGNTTLVAVLYCPLLKLSPSLRDRV